MKQLQKFEVNEVNNDRLVQYIYNSNLAYQKQLLCCSKDVQFIESIGTLEFVPATANNDKNGDWLLLRIDEGIYRYYRNLLESQGIKLENSLWGSHISIIRGKWDIATSDQMKSVVGKKLKFQYGGFGTNGTHWWLNVKAPDIEKFRVRLGLKPLPDFKFHITLGKVESVKGFKVKQNHNRKRGK